MIFLKTEDEIEMMRAANQLVGKTLAEISKVIKPGVTTAQLDKLADEFIRDNGAVPTFKGFPNPYGGPFPASICASVNDQVVHGIPDNRELVDGDIVSVDLEKGIIVNETKNIEVEFQAFEEFMINILSDGGLVNHYLKEKE